MELHCVNDLAMVCAACRRRLMFGKQDDTSRLTLGTELSSDEQSVMLLIRLWGITSLKSSGNLTSMSMRTSLIWNKIKDKISRSYQCWIQEGVRDAWPPFGPNLFHAILAKSLLNNRLAPPPLQLHLFEILDPPMVTIWSFWKRLGLCGLIRQMLSWLQNNHHHLQSINVQGYIFFCTIQMRSYLSCAVFLQCLSTYIFSFARSKWGVICHVPFSCNVCQLAFIVRFKGKINQEKVFNRLNQSKISLYQ